VAVTHSIGSISNLPPHKFGIKALHMGPKIHGYEMQKANSSKKPTYKEVIHDVGDYVMKEDNFTEQQNLLVDLENERRLEARKILDALRDTSSWVDNQNNPPTTADTGDEDKDDSQDPPCPRFNEIRKYFVDNRGILAFETMHFSMGEHVLLSHVVRHNKIQISPEELRAFLKMCHKRRVLFRYVIMISPLIIY